MASCAITLLGVYEYGRSLDKSRADQFEAFVDKSSFHIRERVLAYERGLRGTRSAMVAVGPAKMRLDQFRLFSQTRDPQREFPGSRGFGYVQRVPSSQQQAFLKEVEQLGRSDFQIRQFAKHDGDRFIIKYIEPEAPNRAAIGLDIASESNRRDAVLRAIRSGEAAISAPITLVQADGKVGQAFLLLLAVYPDYPIPTDANSREQVALGATYTPLVIDEVLATIDPAAEGVRLTLADLDKTAGPIQFFGQRQTSPAVLSSSRKLDIFGRTWLAEFAATPEYMATLPADYSLLFSLTGAILSLLLATLVYRERKQRSQEKLNSEHLQALIKNAPTALAMFDPEMRYLAASRRWLDDYSLDNREVIGKSHYELFPNLPEEWKAVHASALRGEELSKNDERITRRDGSTLWLHWAVCPWHRADGLIGGVIIFAEDVSEQYRMISALEVAKEEAEMANRAKTLFLGNMSHEMRTPVHQLNGFVSMFQREDLTEKQNRRLEMMKTSLQRLDSVIGGILTLVDLESRAMTIEQRPIDLAAVCASVIEMTSDSAAKKNISLSLIVETLPERLQGDARHIRTILACYINNAINFSDKGTITVTASCVSEDDAKALVRIAVTDQGIGIPPDKIDRIFEEFEQADSSHTRKFGGTGVGLAVVRKLARLMQGDAGVESTLGQGSTFWATMTLVKSSAPPSSTAPRDDATP